MKRVQGKGGGAGEGATMSEPDVVVGRRRVVVGRRCRRRGGVRILSFFEGGVKVGKGMCYLFKYFLIFKRKVQDTRRDCRIQNPIVYC